MRRKAAWIAGGFKSRRGARAPLPTERISGAHRTDALVWLEQNDPRLFRARLRFAAIVLLTDEPPSPILVPASRTASAKEVK